MTDHDVRLALLRGRLAERGLAATTPTPPPARGPGGPLPLSPGQARMWYLQELAPHSSAYNIAVAFTLTGPLDGARLRQAFETVSRRHDILRTTYQLGADGRPAQQVVPGLLPRWESHDLRTLPGPERDGEADRLARTAATRAFDLSTDAPLRLVLARTGNEEHVLVLVAHHIAWDDECWGLFFGQLTAAYHDGGSTAGGGTDPAAVRHPEPVSSEAQYLDVLAASRPENGDGLAFWRRQLADPPPALALPDVRRLTATATASDHDHDRHRHRHRHRDRDRDPTAGGRLTMRLGPDVGERVREIATRTASTPFIVLLAGFATLLHRRTGARDMLIGSPVVNRDSPAAARTLGYFGNTAALRIRLAAADTFTALVARTRETCLQSFAHRDVEIEQVLRAAGVAGAPGADEAAGPFPVLFALRSEPGDVLAGLTGHAARRPLHNGTAQFPLGLTVEAAAGGMLLEADYRTAVYDEGAVRRLLGQFHRLLDGALADPGRPVGALPLLDPEELVAARARGDGGPALEYRPLAVSIARQAALRANQPAVRCGSVELSYSQLDTRANRLAHHLRGHGVGAEDVVAIALHRGPEMAVAVLAVLKSGAAYLPIDVGYPPAHIARMLAESRPRALVTTTDLAPLLPADVAGRIPVDDPAVAAAIAAAPGADPGVRLPAGQAAYIGYTSGSSGQPKAIVGTQQALANRVGWASRWWPTDTTAVRLGKSSFSFIDGSTELLDGLLVGATVVLADDRAAADPEALADLIRRHPVGQVMLVPGLLGALAETAGDVVRAVPRWLSTGEALSSSLAALVHRTAPGSELVNTYGCSEVAGDVVAGPVPADVGGDGGRPVTIGVPAPGVEAHVLDRTLTPVPAGTVGELYLGGVQLARGYAGRPSATAIRFVASPFAPGERLYRTGDLVRWTSGGNLEYLGRGDEQINIGGFRIEPREVENALDALPDVARAVVDTRVGPAGRPLLVGYLVPARPGVSPEEVRERLRRVLPRHLVPSLIVVLDELPSLPNGKVDRRALPHPVAPATAAASAATGPEPATTTGPATVDAPAPSAPSSEPAGPDEGAARERTLATLCAVMADTLGRPGTTPDDDFFSLGGDSILSLAFVRGARRAGIAFDVHDVFEHRTPARLSAAVPSRLPSVSPQTGGGPPPVHPTDGPGDDRRAAAGHGAGSATALPVAALRPRHEPVDLADYTHLRLLRTDRAVTAQDVGRAVLTLARRHEALRTRVDTSRRNLWRATLRTPAEVNPMVETVPPVLEAGLADELAALRRSARDRLDVGRGDTLRAFVVPVIGQEPPAIALLAHALTVDRSTLGQIAADLAALLAGSGPAGLPISIDLPPPRPERDEASVATTGAANKEVDHWQEVLGTATRPRGPRTDAGGERHHWQMVVPQAARDRWQVIAAFLSALAARGSTEPVDIGMDHDGGQRNVRGDAAAGGWFPLRPTPDASVDELAATARRLAQRRPGYVTVRYGTRHGRVLEASRQPDVLVTGLVLPGEVPPWRALSRPAGFRFPAAGAETYYDLVASFEPVKSGILLDIATADPDAVAESARLLEEWDSALRSM